MRGAAAVPGSLALVGAAPGARGSWGAYVALALGAVLFVFTLWYEVYADTRREPQAWSDPILQSHRQWRLRTAFVFLVWSILAGFCVPFGFGTLVFAPVWLWFVYRVAKGMILFRMGRVI